MTMDPVFSIAFAILALTVAFVVFVAVKRKAVSPSGVTLILGVLLLAALFAVDAFTAVERPRETVDHKDDGVYLASAVASVDPALAEEIAMDSGADESPAGALLMARLNALKGDNGRSYLYYSLYERLPDAGDVSREKKYVGWLLTRYAGSSNGFVKAYYDNSGEADPLAVSGDASALFGSEEAFLGYIADEISKSVPESDSSMRKAGDAVALYAALKDKDQLTEEDLKNAGDAAQKLNRSINKDERLRANDSVREALLGLNCMVGDSEGVAENICDDSVESELKTAVQLLCADYVGSKHVKNVSLDCTGDQLGELEDRCREIYDSARSEMTAEERDAMKEKISVIGDADSQTKVRVVDMLADSAENGSEDPGKSFLVAAMGYDHLGMDKQFSDCVDKALENSLSSPDAEYADNMREVADILNGKSDEDVKNLSSRVDVAVSQATGVDISNMQKVSSGSSLVPVGDDDNDASDPADQSGSSQNFTQNLTRALEKKRAVVNIGAVSVDEFPKVSFVLSFGEGTGIDESNIKNSISITDCGYDITNYQIKKLDDLDGRIILLCDVSGSMQGKEQDLKDAVNGFAKDLRNGEQIAVVGFSSGISFQSPFMSDPDEIAQYADRIYADGGTNMLSAMDSCSGMFPSGVGYDNILIVMTDGKDYDRSTDAADGARIRELVARSSCTVYTVGLGSGAESDYLSLIAEKGNGQYLYVDHADGLESFYSFIHSQLNNRYLVTFEATDQSADERLLEVSLNSSLGYASKNYHLNEGGDHDHDSYADPAKVYSGDDLVLYGFDKKYIYQSKSDITLKLFGENFSKDEKYTVKLSGTIRPYTVSYTYVSDTEISVVIPGSLPADTYSVSVTGDAHKGSVGDALTVAVNVGRQTVKYGAYVFNCDSLTKKSGEVVMRGNVTLNSWLAFSDEVKLVGVVDPSLSESVELVSSGPARVFYDPAGSVGLAKTMAQSGFSPEVLIPDSVRIYSESYDPSSYESFKVQSFVLNVPLKLKSFADVGGSLALYPDMIYTEAFYQEPDFKYFKDLVKNLSKSVFQKNVSGALAITSNRICLKGSLDLSYDKDNDTAKKFRLTKLALNLKSLKVDLDTIKEEYSVGFMVGFEAFKLKKGNGDVPTLDGVGLDLSWKNGGLDSVLFKASGEVLVSTSPVKLYLKKVNFGASDFSQVKNVKDLLNVTVTGGFNLATEDFLKKIGSDKVKKLFNKDSLPLAEIDDAKLNVCLGKLNINFSAKLKILDVQVAECMVNIGKFAYTNDWLGLETDQYGAGLTVAAGLTIDWKNLDLDLHGGVDLTLGYPYSGITFSGNVDFDIHWLVFSWDKSVQGGAGLGGYFNRNNEFQFIVFAKGRKDNGGYKGFRLDWSPSMGVQKTKY